MVTRQTSYELHGQQAYGNGSLTLQAVGPVFFTEPPYWSITVRGNGKKARIELTTGQLLDLEREIGRMVLDSAISDDEARGMR